MTTASTPPNRYLQILLLATAILSAILQSAYCLIKSTYQRLIPQPAKSLQGQVVLVTGAGHGIGKEIALEFWRHGSTVACVDIDENANNLTACDINTRHHQKLQVTGESTKEESCAAYAYTCDVTDRNQVANLAHRVQEDHGHLDILVNNTGIMPIQPPGQVPPAEFIDVLNGNLQSHFWTVLAFLPGMVKRKQGHIVAISSVAGLHGLDSKIPYSGAKHGIAGSQEQLVLTDDVTKPVTKHVSKGLMEALSEELHLDSHNIKLTCAHPYFVNDRTDLPEQLNLRIPELTPEHAASEIVNAVRHNVDTITVPKSLLFWLNVLRTSPQDARDVLRDLFHARTMPTRLPNPSTYQTQVSSEGIKT